MPVPADERHFRQLRGQRVHDNNSVRRTYDLVRATLRAMPPGSPVSEADLISRFAASRNTVRAVLQQLAQEGIVSRGPKVGTVVTGSVTIPLNELAPLATWAPQSPVREEVLDTKLIPAFEAIRQQLQLSPGDTVRMTEGVVLSGSEPLALFVSYVALTHAQADEFGSDQLSVIAALRRYLGVTITESDTMLTALGADQQTAALLDVALGSPIVMVEDLLRDAEGRPRAVSQLRCRADRMAFSAATRRVVQR